MYNSIGNKHFDQSNQCNQIESIRNNQSNRTNQVGSRALTFQTPSSKIRTIAAPATPPRRDEYADEHVAKREDVDEYEHVLKHEHDNMLDIDHPRIKNRMVK